MATASPTGFEPALSKDRHAVRRRSWQVVQRLRQLSITEKAVTQHVSRIYDQFGLNLSDDDHRRVVAVTRYLLA